MVRAECVDKRYGTAQALRQACLTAPQGCVYGLAGRNGAGKTTLLHILSGVLKPNAGEARIGGLPVYENPAAKRMLCYMPDALAFRRSDTLESLAAFHRRAYPRWDAAVFRRAAGRFELPPKKRLDRYSKGMAKLAALACALACRTEALLLDEPLEGVDPLARRTAFELLLDRAASDGTAIVLSSHTLRELEGFCDRVGLMAEGRMLLEEDLETLEGGVVKAQAAFPDGAPFQPAAAYEPVRLLSRQRSGAVETLLLRGERAAVEHALRAQNPLILELLPVTLEEVFLHELGGHTNAIG